MKHRIQFLRRRLVISWRSAPNRAAHERAERGELILHEAASRLGISKMTCRTPHQRWGAAGQTDLHRRTVRETDIDLPAVKRAIKSGRAVSADPRQGILEYQ